MFRFGTAKEAFPKNEDAVLLVEDSSDCQLLVKRSVKGIADITVAPDLATAERLLSENGYGLLILDVHLPDGNGLEFLSDLQLELGVQRPRVIFLTSRTDLTDKLAGFSLGADDYIAKPFNPLEFRARVLSNLRHRKELIAEAQLTVYGRLRFNLAQGTIEAAHQNGYVPIEVSPTEFRLLLLLARNLGRILVRQQLTAVFRQGKARDPQTLERSIDVYVLKLRRKLEGYGYLIESIYGFGYRLMEHPV
jgi:DNA-binding response OmpR family regulator